MNCTEKFIKHSERVGTRFAEQNAGAQILVLVFWNNPFVVDFF